MKDKMDIQNEQDIKLMVDSFYDKVNKDGLLSLVFNDFAGVDWPSHLPRMYAFWNSVLFSKGEYKGSPFDKHIPLPIDATHFDQWLHLFNANIDEHFEGKMAEEAKKTANSIGQIFQHKLKYIKQSR